MSPVTWGVLLALAWLALAAVLALVIGRVVANAETRRGTPHTTNRPEEGCTDEVRGTA